MRTSRPIGPAPHSASRVGSIRASIDGVLGPAANRHVPVRLASFALTGGSIFNVALAATRTAACDTAPIRHVTRARCNRWDLRKTARASFLAAPDESVRDAVKTTHAVGQQRCRHTSHCTRGHGGNVPRIEVSPAYARQLAMR